MNLQKRLASKILKAGFGRVKIQPGKEKEAKEAITNFDIKGLIKKKIIFKIHKKGVSRVRANKTRKQKQKGRKKGKGSRKGSPNARQDFKRTWISKVRSQRELLKRLRKNQKITKESYKMLYLKSKGGFFRSTGHLKLFLEENNLFIKK